MKPNNNQLQQGDVLKKRVTSLPANCKKIGRTVALGEATGHHHSFDDDSVAVMEAPDGVRYAVNSSDTPQQLIHQEHKPVTVDPGIWQIGQVREKDWFRDMVAPVRD